MCFRITQDGREEFHDGVELVADFGRCFRLHKEGNPEACGVNLNAQFCTW